LDLGLARLHRGPAVDGSNNSTPAEATSLLTPKGTLMMMGTPDYMAPEQALDFHGADIRADIYSLGCTFHYLLTGQPPFPDGTVPQKLIRHQQAPPPTLAQLPPGVNAVLARMLGKRPEDRYQTPGEVAQALSRISSSWSPQWKRRAVIAAGLVLGPLG